MSLQPATPKEKRRHEDHSCDTWQQNGQGPEHVAGRQRVTGTWRKQQQPHFHPPAVHQPVGGWTNHAHANVSRLSESMVLDGTEKVYFFTNHLSHSIYGKYISLIREHKIPFGYLHSINLETIIKQIHKDLNA